MAEEGMPLDMYATGVVQVQPDSPKKVGGGRYSLKKILGRGGMGVVWLAYDEQLKHEVALKFLPPQIRFDPVALDDLRRETARSQKLSHPNIIRIHDFSDPEGEDAFISMEYVNGSNLGALRVQQKDRLFTWLFLEPLVAQLCDALEYAHRQGIIHRDLKPANLMVDQAGQLKLTDFGVARAVTDTMSRSSIGQTSGTLVYMSPQQLEGGLPKISDDIYALGATLYELLTSNPPFFTGDLLHQVRTVAPQPLQLRLRALNLANEIPSHVEQVILDCLYKIETQRPRTAREVAERFSSGARPMNLARRVPHPSKMIASLSGAVRKRRAWYWGGAAAMAVAALAWVMIGRTDDKAASAVAARSKPELAGESAAQPALTVSAEQNPPPSASPSRSVPITAANAVIPSPPAVRPEPPAMPPSQRATLVAPQAALRPMPGAAPSASTLAPSSAPTTLSQVSASSVASLPLPDAAKQPTALQLARQGNAHVSERSKNQIVKILSDRAPVDLPPSQWCIHYYDPKARSKSVEVRFESGEMARVHEPTRILKWLNPRSQKAVDVETLKIDSDEALRIALSLTVNMDLVIRSVEYELERGYGGLPVWKIRLFGSPGKQFSDDKGLGYAIVLADDGKVLKETLSKNQGE